MNSIMAKIGNYFKVFCKQIFVMFLYAALLFNQRGFTYHKLYPALSPALVHISTYLAISTSLGKSFTTLCLSLLCSLPLDCELLEGPCRNHCYIPAPCTVPGPEKVLNKCLNKSVSGWVNCKIKLIIPALSIIQDSCTTWIHILNFFAFKERFEAT